MNKSNKSKFPNKGAKSYQRSQKRGKKQPSARDEYDARNAELSSQRNGKNDISWYSRNPELVQAAGSFPYPYRPGMTITTVEASATQALKNVYTSTIPGVCAIDWMPSIGKANNVTDPINIVAKELYSKVRSKFSGSLEADPPDFVIYLMALDSIFAYIAALKRIYRLVDAWSPNNYATPDVILTAIGFTVGEIEQLRLNKVQFWQYINELVLMSRKFTCPAEMDVFNRHYWMSDNVYTDAATINSQFYIYNLTMVYKYVELPVVGSDPVVNAGGLGYDLVPWANGARTVGVTPSTMYLFGKSLINALAEWDDAYTINGYLNRAYEGSPQFIVDELPLEQPFNPVYEPEVLAQIENTTSIPGGVYFMQTPTAMSRSDLYVQQSVTSNTLVSNPKYKITAAQDPLGEGTIVSYATNVINLHNDAPTPADNVIATRMKTSVSGSYSAGFTIECATEIPLSIRVITNTATQFSAPWLLGVVVPQYAYVNVSTAATATVQMVETVINMYKSLLALEQFDWHPFCFPGVQTVNRNSATISGDIYNITTVTDTELANLHRVCLLSEFNAFEY